MFLFDECDKPIVEKHRWHLNKVGHTSYVRSTDTGEYLHRLIMRSPDCDIDHENGVGTDCRRANLRLATRSQNNMNRRSQRSGRKGIHFERFTGLWRAELEVNGKRYRSKRVRTEQEAISIREFLEAEHHGRFSGHGTQRD